MKVKWLRGKDQFLFTRPETWFALGIRGSGKSSHLEHIGLHYLQQDCVILDLFGSRDGEGLAWLRSPEAKDKKILLVKGDGCDVDSCFPVKHCDSLKLEDFEKFDVIVSASPLYRNIGEEFFYAAKITDLLYQRLHYKRLIYMICREAANLYYSRLKVNDNQLFAKSQMIYMIREARHIGVALGCDSVRFYAIDIDVRSLSDYLLIKNQGMQGLPKDLKFLYSYVEPHLFRQMNPDEYIVLTDKGSIGYGYFPEVSWHKRERENILDSVGVDVNFGDAPLKRGKYRGTYNTVGDSEHCEIIRLYVDEGLNMHQVAATLKGGRSTGTVLGHIHKHNDSVRRSEFCPTCKRANSPFAEKLAQRNKK